MDTNKRLNIAEWLFIAAAAVITMLICTKSSPLYPFNDWVDANCFLTVGRSMLYGLLPYRDLFEQKGPLLYFIHAAAALVSQRSFFGVFIIELILCMWTLTASYSLLHDTCGRASICFVPLIAAVMYSSRAFCHGDSAEEICLPLMLTSLIIGLRFVREGRPLTFRGSFAVGVLSGTVLWIKFSLLGFYLGFFIVPAVLAVRKGGLMHLLRTIGMIALGVVTVTAPILLFFAVNGALSDLFEVYFYDNLFLYRSESSVPANLLAGLQAVWRWFPAIFLLTAVTAMILIIRKKSLELAYFLPSLAAAFLLVFGGGRAYTYYPFALAVFVPYAAAVTVPEINSILRKIPVKAVPAICTVSLVLGGGLCGLFSRNTYLMKYAKKDMPQFIFADIMAETPGATMLNYGFLDGGFYTASGMIPTCRFFCRINLPYDEMDAQQRYIAENGLADYLVMRAPKNKSPRAPELYELVAETEFPYYSQKFTYYLYRLRA